MAWGFTERIGIELKYTPAEVAGFLSLAGFISLLGPILVTVIGFKFGVKLPLLFGLAFAGLTTFAIFLSVNTSSLFEVAVLFFSGSYFFGISYLTAYAATLDLDGRIVAASGSAMVFGVAVGPALSGYLINNGGYAMGAWATLALVVLMVIVAIISIKWGLRSTKEGPLMKN